MEWYEIKELFKGVGLIVLGILLVLIIWIIIWLPGAYYAVDDIKQNSEAVFQDNGFVVIGYQGYESKWPVGGMIWYTAEKKEITYQAGIMKWGNEYHLYNLEAIDAIKP